MASEEAKTITTGTSVAPTQQDVTNAIGELKQASAKYQTEYFGHFLNEDQVDDARSGIAEMGTAATHLYDLWHHSRDALPTSSEIGRVVEPLTLRSRLVQLVPRRAGGQKNSADKRRSRFTELAHLNERVRRTAEAVTEALPALRDQVLYARHFERNCMRLYAENGETERLRDAEDLRLTLEQTLQNIQGDVDSLRAQTQSLTLYAQMHLAMQVQILTVIILAVTMLGVIAAFAHR
jgi:hypothetical protein